MRAGRTAVQLSRRSRDAAAPSVPVRLQRCSRTPTAGAWCCARSRPSWAVRSITSSAGSTCCAEGGKSVVEWDPGRTFEVWHDRAVLPFLTSDEDRRAYAARAASAVATGGWITIGGFAPDGPTSCSGLPVRGASSQDLAALFAPNFTVAEEARVVHTTPAATPNRSRGSPRSAPETARPTRSSTTLRRVR